MIIKGVKLIMFRAIIAVIAIIISTGFTIQSHASPNENYFLPVNVDFIKPNGVAVHDLEVSDYRPNGKTYYVNINIGADTNDGLTPGTAFKSVNKALTKSDIDVMILAPGTYGWDYSGAAITVSRSLAIISEGGRAQLTTHDKLTWLKSSGYRNIYEAPRTFADTVYDTTNKDEFGDYQRLIKKNSLLDVDNNPGSWYTDGAKVYVHTVDSRVVNNEIRVYIASNGFRYTGEGTLYLENIDFEGGYSSLRMEGNNPNKIAKLYAKNTTFKYASVRNGLTVLGAYAYIQGCTAASNYLDGFNYHALNGITPMAVETESTGRNNGWERGHSNNGSTMHDGGSIVRINGKYYNNDGPNIADVNAAKSWNVSVESYNSAVKGLQGTNFYNDGEMWLDKSISYGSTYDLVAGEGTIYEKYFYTRDKNLLINGTVSNY